jgi:hypothetical protein
MLRGPSKAGSNSRLGAQGHHLHGQESMTEFDMAGAFLASAVASSQDHFIMKFSDIRFDKQIGAGAAAEVYKGTYREMDVAIKKMRFTSKAAVVPG